MPTSPGHSGQPGNTSTEAFYTAFTLVCISELANELALALHICLNPHTHYRNVIQAAIKSRITDLLKVC